MGYWDPPDEPTFCEVCGQDVEYCFCPECPVCWEHGALHCYEQHGLGMMKHQTVLLQIAEDWDGHQGEIDDALARSYLEECVEDNNVTTPDYVDD